VFQPSLVPGLLQTAEYAQLRLSQWAELNRAGGVKEAVAARMARQEALYDPTKSFSFVLTEGALRARLCPRKACSRSWTALARWPHFPT
jgi:Domain of unknown function (DUF5753)